jgi:acetyltransferase-like isoleucine patch superfamily enzyme
VVEVVAARPHGRHGLDGPMIQSVLGRLRRRRRRLRRPAATPRSGYEGWHDPKRITMGRHSYGDPQIIAYDDASGGRVEIGSFCSIAAGVRFLIDGAHRHEFITSSPLAQLAPSGPPGHARSQGPTIVGHDVWIGRDATILSGLTIGTGAVIGACAVVAGDVRPYAIAVGNPAREVGRRFTDEECDSLLKLRWWEWPDERIQASIEGLWSSDVRCFLERWGT